MSGEVICLCNDCYAKDKNKLLSSLKPCPSETQRKHKNYSRSRRKQLHLRAPDPPDYVPDRLTLGKWQKLIDVAAAQRVEPTLEAALRESAEAATLPCRDAVPAHHDEPQAHSAHACVPNNGSCHAGPSDHHQDHDHQAEHDVADEVMIDGEAHGHDDGDDVVGDTEDLEALHGFYPGFDGGHLATSRECRRFPDLEGLLAGVHLHDRVKKFCYKLMWDKVVNKMTVVQVESQLRLTIELVEQECIEQRKPCLWYPRTYHQLMAVVFGADDGCNLGNEVVYDVCAHCYTVYRGLQEVNEPATSCRNCQSPREGCLKYHYR